jgi:putative addiction module component (TIGR02574 family)
MEKIWESIPEHSDELDLTDAQKHELNRRLDAIQNKTAKFTTWPHVRATAEAQANSGDRGVQPLRRCCLCRQTPLR